MTVTWQFGNTRGAGIPCPSTACVVKIGGSIFRRPDWPTALEGLLARLPPSLLVVGGGSVVDGLRLIDAVNPRPPELMHELAIRAMRLTAEIVANALDVPLVESTCAAPPAVLDVAAWLARTAPDPELPAGWAVTSDSIAAAVAGAGRRPLVLAKSKPPPTDALGALAATGWVDDYFPTAAALLTAIHWAVPEEWRG